MAKKIFGLASIPLGSDYIQPDIGEAEPGTAVIFLCEHEGKAYFTFDDAETTVTEGQGDYAVNILDSANPDDAAIMTAIKPKVDEMQREIAGVDGELLTTYSLVVLMAGVVADDADIKAAIAQTTTDKAAVEAKYGF